MPSFSDIIHDSFESKIIILFLDEQLLPPIGDLKSRNEYANTVCARTLCGYNAFGYVQLAAVRMAKLYCFRSSNAFQGGAIFGFRRNIISEGA